MKTIRFLTPVIAITFVFLFLAVDASPALAARYHVTPAGDDANDGTSWQESFATVQKALSAASSDDEIWVAAGVYYPDEGGVYLDNDRNSTFTLVDGVEMYGGFNGDEAALEERNVIAYVTVLSGDIDGDDVTDTFGVTRSYDDIRGANAYHVVTGALLSDTTLLDGFTITAGQAALTDLNGAGGGIRVSASSPQLRELTIAGNFAAGDGGGFYAFSQSSVYLTNATISGNTARSGGGIGGDTSSFFLNDVTISNNNAENNGGGIYLGNASTTISQLTDVTISDNKANGRGAGMCTVSSSAELRSVTIVGNENTSRTGQGGGMYNEDSPLSLTDVTIRANRCTGSNSSGGGVYNTASSPSLTQVSIIDNQSSSGGGVYNQGSSPIFTNVTISSNNASYVGGVSNKGNSYPQFTNVTIAYNRDGRLAGGLYDGIPASSTLRNTIVAANVGPGGQGARRTTEDDACDHVTLEMLGLPTAKLNLQIETVVYLRLIHRSKDSSILSARAVNCTQFLAIHWPKMQAPLPVHRSRINGECHDHSHREAALISVPMNSAAVFTSLRPRLRRRATELFLLQVILR
jgi:parallel beta-helix repeat protein